MEKRHFTRVLFKTEAMVQYKEKCFREEVMNLSMKGMFFKTKERIPLEESVDIRIFLSGGSSELAINVAGKVVRQEEEGLAVKFDEIDIDSFIHLKNVVAYNTGDEAHVTEELHQFLKLAKAARDI
ncbi:MAG: PilZ domain-containing protein [Desulforhabdus sp.]|jgi:hypothetical protein|nr:PilZ domain-containing protein [Desulforhabdus sp.]